ncbi:MAG: CcmD family protein [Chloroflexi bacterium]|nr:CcmD family protein [Chloroflexota bacterium]
MPKRLGLRTGLAVFGGWLLWLAGAGAVLASGPGQVQLPGEGTLPYLFAVYTVTWLAFFAYALSMSRRQRELLREIEELQRELEEKRGGQQGHT